MKTTPPTIHPSQLFPGERVQRARLASGQEITVITRRGLQLYAAPGRPGNFAQIGDLPPMPEQHYFFTRIKGGAQVQLQLNAETGVLCISVVQGNAGRDFHLDLTRDGGRRFVLESLAA